MTCKIHPTAVPSGGSNVTAMAITREEVYRKTAFNPVCPTNPGPSARYRVGNQNSAHKFTGFE